jgi:hypothetical protein
MRKGLAVSMQTPPASSARHWLAALLIAFALAVVGVGATYPAASAQGAHGAAKAQDAAKKKKKKARKRTCRVRRLVGGRLRYVTHRVWRYKTVRRGGRRVRVIVRKRVAFRTSCKRRCVLTRNGKVVYRRVRKKVLVPRRVNGRRRLVRVRKRVKVPRLVVCTGDRNDTILGTPITITLTEGSVGLLDFGAFIREAPLRGSVRGFIPGRFDISALTDDVTFTLTRGRIEVQPVGIFIDDECGGEVSAAIRTSPDTHVDLDQSRESTGTLFADSGRIQSIVRVLLIAPLELRNGEQGCTAPYITTGYTQTPIRLSLNGKLSFSGSLGVNLSSGEQLLDEFDACIDPGDPTEPCDGFAIPFAFVLTTKIVATMEIGQYGRIRTP